MPVLAEQIDIDALSKTRSQQAFSDWYDTQLGGVANAIKRLNNGNTRIFPGVKWDHATKGSNRIVDHYQKPSRGRIVPRDTGMRRGEILQQRWEHFDLDRKLLFVSRSKTAGGEGPEIPLTGRVFSLLQSLRRDEGLVFTFKGKPIRAVKAA